VIGHNVWVGQNCVLNAEDDLTIGNHVGIGAYSSVYTHGYFGDLLEGCQVFKVGPVTIEDDVWILGSYNIISPGVTLGAKSLILTGAKNWSGFSHLFRNFLTLLMRTTTRGSKAAFL
jgi:acetyltransferase-like isoleucine patch superfamily enzyme